MNLFPTRYPGGKLSVPSPPFGILLGESLYTYNETLHSVSRSFLLPSIFLDRLRGEGLSPLPAALSLPGFFLAHPCEPFLHADRAFFSFETGGRESFSFFFSSRICTWLSSLFPFPP